MATQKTYGLLIPKDKKSKPVISKTSVFGDDDDEPVNLAKAVKKVGTDAVLKRKTQLEIDKAIEEDPSVYEYDEIYDNIQKSKLDNTPAANKEKDKKPKYIAQLLRTADHRKKEHERRVERQVQKERDEEQGKFGDKEKFVTGAYRKKMLEMQEAEEEERRQEQMEAMLDVTKQKDISGFYRHLLKQTTGEVIKVKEEVKEILNIKAENKEIDFSQDRDATDSDNDLEGDFCAERDDKPTPNSHGKSSTNLISQPRKGQYRKRASNSDSESSTDREQCKSKNIKSHQDSYTSSHRRSRSPSKDRQHKQHHFSDRRKNTSLSLDRDRQYARKHEGSASESRSPDIATHQEQSSNKIRDRSTSDTATQSYSMEKKNESRANSVWEKFPKRNVGTNVDIARSRYLERKMNRTVAIVHE